MKTPVVGWFARKMRCIAVERPQDLARSGTGKITIMSETLFKGIGTVFKKEICVGDTIKLPGSNIPEQIVEKILSDEELEVKAPGINFYEMDA